MQARTTLVLLALALALGAWVYFGEIGGDQRREASEKAARRLLDVAAADLSSIEVRSESGEKGRVERRADGWRLVEPLDFAVDAFTVDRLAEGVAGLESKA